MGTCLLVGAIEYNSVATLIFLILTANGAIASLIAAIVLFDISLSLSAEKSTVFVEWGAALLVEVAIETYFWLCTFGFYRKLKSRDVSAPHII